MCSVLALKKQIKKETRNMHIIQQNWGRNFTKALADCAGRLCWISRCLTFADCRLQTADYRLQTAYSGPQTVDCKRLGTWNLELILPNSQTNTGRYKITDSNKNNKPQWKYKDQKKQRKQIVQSLFRWFGVVMFWMSHMASDLKEVIDLAWTVWVDSLFHTRTVRTNGE